MNQAEISKWGAIAAQLDDPFTEHAALLASHGLSPDQWNSLLKQIRGATDHDSKLQVAFVRGYGLVKQGKRSPEQSVAMRGLGMQGLGMEGPAMQGLAAQAVAAQVVAPPAEPIDPGDVTRLPPIARVVPSYLQANPVEIKEPPVAAVLSVPATPSVLRRSVLTEEMWTAVANAWAQRVAADPATRERYFELVRTIRPGGR